MPPQQTNITPETERNAAGLGLDLPIALAKDAMVEALAAQRLNASIATRTTLCRKRILLDQRQHRRGAS